MKEAQGVVVSAKMRRTVVVRIEQRVEHPRFKKYIIQRTKVKARDDVGCKEGDVVSMAHTRPVSKEVRWRILRVEGKRSLPDALPEGTS